MTQPTLAQKATISKTTIPQTTISKTTIRAAILLATMAVSACGSGSGSGASTTPAPAQTVEETQSDLLTSDNELTSGNADSDGSSNGNSSNDNNSSASDDSVATTNDDSAIINDSTGSGTIIGGTNANDSGSNDNTADSNTNSTSDNGSVGDGVSVSDSTDDTTTDNTTTNDANFDGDAGTACALPQYLAGTAYQGGNQVVNNGTAYQCDIAGWCSSDAAWAYAPGTGSAWQSAWHSLGDCAQLEADDSPTDDQTNSDEGSGNITDDNITNDNADSSDNSGDDDIENDSNNTTGNDLAQSDYVVGTYFVEWGVYGRNYHVADMPAEKLTHVLYGFIPICGPNQSLQEANPSGYSALVQQCSGKPDYSVVVHDKFAALEKSYPGDQWDDPIRGNFGQLIKMKQAHPHIKVLPSVGGWTLSDPFFTLANDPDKRAVFVNSVAEFLRSYSFFDGVDIDWEFPGGGGANATLGSSADYQGYANLVRDLRQMLDGMENELGKKLYLSSAIGAAPARIAAVNYGEAQMYLDHIFLMSYDYYGAWSTELGHQTALHDSDSNSHAGFYAAAGVENLLLQGVASKKIVVGVAMYGRGWSKISGGGIDNPFTGQGTSSTSWQGEQVNKVDGSWEDGVLDYKDIVTNYLGGTQGSTGINGFQYYYDETAEAPYLWNHVTGTLITYDNPRSATAKGQYVQQHQLGGVFSWEIDADNGDLIDAMRGGLAQ